MAALDFPNPSEVRLINTQSPVQPEAELIPLPCPKAPTVNHIIKLLVAKDPRQRNTLTAGSKDLEITAQ